MFSPIRLLLLLAMVQVALVAPASVSRDCSCFPAGTPVCGSRYKMYRSRCHLGRHLGQTCPTTYQPVCGSNGRTYRNICIARREGARSVRQGACSQAQSRRQVDMRRWWGAVATACNCSNSRSPVCDTEGNTHQNRCFLQCRNKRLAYNGQCRSSAGCSCPEMYSPVCDTQGQTHVSECKMKCQRRSIAHSGPCASSYGCGCPAQFQPVCDTQGNNHPSRCALQCARARFAYDGSCLRFGSR